MPERGIGDISHGGESPGKCVFCLVEIRPSPGYFWEIEDVGPIHVHCAMTVVRTYFKDKAILRESSTECRLCYAEKLNKGYGCRFIVGRE